MLLPIFRSETQSELLAALFLNPGREWNMHELSQHTGGAYTTVHREASRLLKAGLLSERRVGQARLLQPNEQAPAFRPLRDLLVVCFGAVPLLAEHLAHLDGIEAVAVYGSYAERMTGVPGEPPQDVDVLVVGTPDPLQVYAAAREVTLKISRPVNPTLMDRQEWEQGTGFLRDLRAKPMLPVLGDLGPATVPA